MSAWEERLRSHGYRVTEQRVSVLNAVSELNHGTPEEILVRVQADSPRVNLSTIYRTLEVLEEVGLVRHAHLGHGSPTYHSVDEAMHIHLVCRACGAIDSAPAQTAEPFCAALERDHGFSTDLGHMTVHGLCRNCRTEAPHDAVSRNREASDTAEG